MSVNTVIFDLDGTLLYTLEDLTDSVNYALSEVNAPQRTIQEIKSFLGNGVYILIKNALPEGADELKISKCISIFKEHYSQNMFNKTKPYDGIIDLLKQLKQNGYKTAVLSNKFDSAVKTLVTHYFDGLIDTAAGQKENIDKKPAPDGVNEIITELNADKSECIMVGDSEVDIQTANNSGIPCISVTWGYKDINFLYNNGAETLIYSPDELLELI